jgi:hypothetical protein
MQRGSNGVAVAEGIAVHEQAGRRDAEMMPPTKMGGQRADRAKARQLISKCLLACIGRALFISQTTSNLASFL